MGQKITGPVKVSELPKDDFLATNQLTKGLQTSPRCSDFGFSSTVYMMLANGKNIFNTLKKLGVIPF